MKEKENFVVVSGGFDPMHSGHIALFKNASKNIYFYQLPRG
jgi:phosphopantetheine adenylyltransferase